MGNTKIVHQITGQYMKMNKKRTLTTFLGIVFMVLLLTCVFVGKDTAIEYMREVASEKNGKWHIAFYDLNQEDYSRLSRVDYVKKTVQSKHLGLTTIPFSENQNRPFLNIRGMEAEGFDWCNVTVLAGRLPQNDRELIVSESVYAAFMNDDYDFSGQRSLLGQTFSAQFFGRKLKSLLTEGETFFPYDGVTLKAGAVVDITDSFPYFADTDSFQILYENIGDPMEYTVVGIMKSTDTDLSSDAGALAYTCLKKEAFYLNASEENNVFIMLDLDRLKVDSIWELENLVGKQCEENDYVMIFSGKSGDKNLNFMITACEVFFLSLIILASVVLIYNVFNLSYRERCKYLGMLSSVGATGKQKRSSVYYEAFSLLRLALPLGFGLGLPVIYFGMRFLSPFIQQVLFMDLVVRQIPVSLKITVSAVLFVIAFSILTVFVSAYLPARHISKVGAIQSIRGEEKNKKQYNTSRQLGKWLGAEGMLAGSFLTRQRRKRRGISLAITVFLVILLVTSYASKGIHTVLDKKLGNEYELRLHRQPGDLYLEYFEIEEAEEGYYQNSDYQALKEELSRNPEIEKIQEIVSEIYAFYLEDSFVSDAYREAVKGIMKAQNITEKKDKEGNVVYSSIEEAYNRHFVEYRNHGMTLVVLPDEMFRKIAENCHGNEDILYRSPGVSGILLDHRSVTTENLIFGKTEGFKAYDIPHASSLKVGDSFQAYVDNANYAEITIGAIAEEEDFRDYLQVSGESFFTLLMDRSSAEKLAASLEHDSIYQFGTADLIITPKGDGKAVRQKLIEVSGAVDNLIYVADDYAEMAKTFSTAIGNLVDWMLICFVVLTSMICLLNLISSIQGRILDQKQEFAVLQSVGMTRKQIEKMLCLEAGGILAEAFLISVLLSEGFFALIRYGLNALVGRLNIVVPYGLVAGAFVGTVLVVFGLTIGFFRRVKDENILENIRNDSV